jgi:hypothetical protein
MELMSYRSARLFAAAIVVVAGLVGLHYHVEYSGWAVLCGLFVIL